MANHRTCRTSLVFSVALGGEEQEPDLILTYSVTPGASATRDEPGYAASAELHTAHVQLQDGSKVALPEWMFGMLYADERLMDDLLTEAADADEYAREQAADARREDMRMESGR